MSEIDQDELENAFEQIVQKQRIQKEDGYTEAGVLGCTSFIQRRLQIGYNHAARLLEEMERRFWITEPNSSGARQIIRQDMVG